MRRKSALRIFQDMLLVVKLLLVAFGVFGQGYLMPDRESPVASDLDTLAFPDDHPEWVLARRAMASEGLCHPGHPGHSAPADSAAGDPALAERPAGGDEADISDYSILRLVADACE
jgi:hypothetical protein